MRVWEMLNAQCSFLSCDFTPSAVRISKIAIHSLIVQFESLLPLSSPRRKEGTGGLLCIWKELVDGSVYVLVVEGRIPSDYTLGLETIPSD